MPDQFIYSADDVLRMLDALVMDRGGAWWSEFLAEHSTTCPFLVDWPDESLAEWFGRACSRRDGYSNWAAGTGGTPPTWPAWAAASMPSTSRRRQMKKTGGQGPCSGEDFLWTLLATKTGS